jgi:hypothetical protein
MTANILQHTADVIHRHPDDPYEGDVSNIFVLKPIDRKHIYVHQNNIRTRFRLL